MCKYTKANPGTVEVAVGSDDPNWQADFDDLRLVQTGGLIVQEQHQYAYGAPLPGLSYATDAKTYRHGYQGQFAEKDAETGWDSFEARTYDSRIGRWLSPDAISRVGSAYVGMGNNPALFVDSDGNDIFIMSYTKISPNQQGVSDALKVLYNTKNGKNALDEYLNNPSKNLYITVVNQGNHQLELPNGTVSQTEGYTTTIRNPRSFKFDSQLIRLPDYIKWMYEPFNGLELPNSNSINTFISVASSSTYSLYDLSGVLAHEIIAHAANGQSEVQAAAEQHRNPLIWGARSSTNIPMGSVAAITMSQIGNVLKQALSTLRAPSNLGRPISAPKSPNWIEKSR